MPNCNEKTSHDDVELGRDDTLSVEDTSPKPRSRIYSHLWNDVDPNQATLQAAAFCFMTGFIGCVSFSAIFMYCGFQTGNLIQLAIAIARRFQGPPVNERDRRNFRKADQQSLTSLVTFNLGACLGRVGDWMGSLTRMWLILGTMMQALLTMSAALVLWKSGQGSIGKDRGDPAWSDSLTFFGIAFLSASMGLQGIMGRRLNTQFGTTIVLTTAWLEVMTDPKLFKLQWVKSREHRLLAIASLFMGAFIGRALVDEIGMAGTLGIGTVLRFIIAVSWLAVRGKQ